MPLPRCWNTGGDGNPATFGLVGVAQVTYSFISYSLTGRKTAHVDGRQSSFWKNKNRCVVLEKKKKENMADVGAVLIIVGSLLLCRRRR